MEIKHKPMLCVDADLSKITYPIMGFPKLDGVRMINLTGRATARTLKEHGNVFTTDKFSNPIYLGIDGEATIGDITRDSLCRDTSSAMSTINGEPDITWNAFDYLHPAVIDLPYIERYNKLVEYVNINKPPNVNVIEYVWLNNEDEVNAFYDECLNLGYEGIVLRNPSGLHKDGRCTANEANYLRLKPSSDKEALVLKLVEARTNLNEKKTNLLGLSERSSHKENLVGKGMVGMLVCKDLTTGIYVDVGPGKMTHEERLYYWNHPEEIVKYYIKYRSMDKGIKDKPRFPRYISKRAKEDIIFEGTLL
jgi:DNA ligase-1